MAKRALLSAGLAFLTQCGHAEHFQQHFHRQTPQLCHGLRSYIPKPNTAEKVPKKRIFFRTRGFSWCDMLFSLFHHLMHPLWTKLTLWYKVDP